jgi:AP-2 complex subunit alpha
MVRLTIRATDESVPPVLLKLMQHRLARGFATHSEPLRPPTKREISDAFSNVLVGSEENGR